MKTIAVQVKYFAVLRELLGLREEQVECPEQTTVGQLLELLEGRHEALSGKMGRLAVAVDHQYASPDTALRDGAEIALLPPVAGGEAESQAFLVLETPLSLERVTELVKADSGGAIATFTGMVRLHSQGRTVERLEYEAYTPMAVKELERIGQEMAEKWPQARVAIHHRIGALHVGDLAVVIAVCTPHRQPAFDACSYAIERLKQSVPIWKKEFFTDGSTWVGWGP